MKPIYVVGMLLHKKWINFFNLFTKKTYPTMFWHAAVWINAFFSKAPGSGLPTFFQNTIPFFTKAIPKVSFCLFFKGYSHWSHVCLPFFTKVGSMGLPYLFFQRLVSKVLLAFFSKAFVTIAFAFFSKAQTTYVSPAIKALTAAGKS